MKTDLQFHTASGDQTTLNTATREELIELIHELIDGGCMISLPPIDLGPHPGPCPLCGHEEPH